MQEREKLIGTLTAMGYPASFGGAIADQLRTERAMGRMLGYLRQAHPHSPEEIADELVAILEQRDRQAKKKAAEYYNGKYNTYLASRVVLGNADDETDETGGSR